jgi:hypothetical protein
MAHITLLYGVLPAGQSSVPRDTASTAAASGSSSSSSGHPSPSTAHGHPPAIAMQQQPPAGASSSAATLQQQEAAAAAAARAHAFRNVLTFSDDEEFTVAVGGVTESDTDTEELMGRVDWSLAQNSDDEWPPGPAGPPR